MGSEATLFDPAEFLKMPDAQEELIADALASEDAHYIANAVDTVARARGMTRVTDDTEV